jgi:hypothetical protein
MPFDFTVVPVADTEMSEDLAEALYAAGCDDCTPMVSNGVPLICFHREAVNMHEAIRSAVADVQRAGCKVSRVQIEADAIADMIAVRT